MEQLRNGVILPPLLFMGWVGSPTHHHRANSYKDDLGSRSKQLPHTPSFVRGGYNYHPQPPNYSLSSLKRPFRGLSPQKPNNVHDTLFLAFFPSRGFCVGVRFVSAEVVFFSFFMFDTTNESFFFNLL